VAEVVEGPPSKDEALSSNPSTAKNKKEFFSPFSFLFLKCGYWSQAWWHMPIIPATWEVAIRRSRFEASLGKKVSEIPSQQTSQV
jgi:hypothetical protein